MTTDAAAPEVPQAIDAERSILAAMLFDPEAARRLVGTSPAIVTRSDFYRAAHQHIFDAIAALTSRGETADLITAAHELTARGTLDLAGGLPAIAELSDVTTTSANLPAHCRLVREAASRRRAMKLSSDLHAGATDPGVNLSDLLAAIGRRAPEIAADLEVKRPATLLEQVETVEDAIERGVPPVESLIGQGLMVCGGITLLASLPKFGKTFLAMQAQRALANGSPWLNFPTRTARSLMLQLEMPLAGMVDRFRSTINQCHGQIDLLVQPERWDSLTNPRIVDELCTLIEQRRIEFVVADPVRALHAGDENSGPDQGALIDAIRLVCRRTGVAFCLLHHVKKLELEKGSDLRTGVLLAVRGSTRYASDVDTILGLVRIHGQTRLVFAGARFGAFPESIAIRQDADGWFSVIDTPEQAGNEIDQAIAKFLLAAGPAGMTVADLVRMVKKGERTVRAHLTSMGCPSLATDRAGRLRYFLPETLPTANEEFGGGDF